MIYCGVLKSPCRQDKVKRTSWRMEANRVGCYYSNLLVVVPLARKRNVPTSGRRLLWNVYQYYLTTTNYQLMLESVSIKKLHIFYFVVNFIFKWNNCKWLQLYILKKTRENLIFNNIFEVRVSRVSSILHGSKGGMFHMVQYSNPYCSAYASTSIVIYCRIAIMYANATVLFTISRFAVTLSNRL